MTQINKPNFGYTNGINNAAGVRKSDFGSKVAPRDKAGETTVKDVSVVQEMHTNEQVQQWINEAVAYANNSGSDMNLYELRSKMNNIMYNVQNYSETLYENAGSLDIHIEFEFNGKKYSINCNYSGEVKNPYPATNTNVIPKRANISNTATDFDPTTQPKNGDSNEENPVSVKINNLISMCKNGYSTLNDVREVLDYLVSQDSIDNYNMSIENGVATISFKFAGLEYKLEFNKDGTANGTTSMEHY